MKPKAINNWPTTIITNVSKSPVMIKNKLKKKYKKNWFLITIYVLVFGLTATTSTIFLLNDHATYSDNNFNPHSHDNLWEQYYQNNKPNNQLIVLTTTQNFFKDEANGIMWQVHSVQEKNSINFSSVLAQIDNKLQTANIENNNEQTDKSLPTKFFQNVINNPAVDFTINNEQVTSDSFKWPEDYKKSNSYNLKVTTSNEASSFGIKNNNISFVIKVTITNLLRIDIKNVTLDNLNPNQVIYAKNEAVSNVTISDITKYIQPVIKYAFVKKMTSILEIDSLSDKDYRITFNKNDSKTYDFNKRNVKVNFQITSTEASLKDNFTGTLESSINVKNEVCNLDKETKLQTQIQDKYPATETDKNKWLNIIIDTKTDKNNVDTSLTNEGLKTANDTINSVIKPFVLSYFNDKYLTLDLQNDDIVITSDLKLKDNLFQNDPGLSGKKCTITLKPKESGYKLNGSLDMNITVHGSNSSETTQTYSTPDNFKIDGIKYGDDKDDNFLQDNEHYYEQKSLFKLWMSDDKDSLKSKLKNAYSIDGDSCTGTFSSEYKLDGGNVETVNGKIEDFKNDKIQNFYDLINNTKSIWLYTNVKNNSSNRSLINVQLKFSDDNNPPKDNNHTLYSIDMVLEKSGISISSDATLEFTNFKCYFSYKKNN